MFAIRNSIVHRGKSIRTRDPVPNRQIAIGVGNRDDALGDSGRQLLEWSTNRFPLPGSTFGEAPRMSCENAWDVSQRSRKPPNNSGFRRVGVDQIGLDPTA